MQAVRQYRFGGPEQLRYETVPDPQPGSGQVRIAVGAAGVHLLDTVIRSGQAPPRAVPVLPMTPGREVAGVVDVLGPGVDSSLLGRHVVADLGARSGGYAELAIASADALHLLPDHVADDAAIAVLGSGRTTMAILELADPQPGDCVIVTGAAGGVGTLLLQAVRDAGASAVGVVRGERKAAVVTQLGASAVDLTLPDWEARLRACVGGSGASLLLDGVGGEVGTALLDALAPSARVVMFGTASGSPISLSADDVFARGITVHAAVGARLLRRPGGLRPLEAQALGALAAGRFTPVVDSAFALRDADAAHHALEARTAIGKVLLKP